MNAHERRSAVLASASISVHPRFAQSPRLGTFVKQSNRLPGMGHAFVGACPLGTRPFARASPGEASPGDRKLRLGTEHQSFAWGQSTNISSPGTEHRKETADAPRRGQSTRSLAGDRAQEHAGFRRWVMNLKVPVPF